MDINTSAEIPLLSSPGKELEWEQKIVFQRLYPDGSKKIAETTSKKIFKDEGEPATYMQAYDTNGLTVMDFTGQVITGQANGWEYHVDKQQNGLPEVIKARKVSKSGGEMFADAMMKRLEERVRQQYQTSGQEIPEGAISSEIEQINQEIHIEYDDLDRPVKRRVFQELDLKDNRLFPDKKVYLPQAETDYHYDRNGRLLAVATYGYGNNGVRVLGNATLYEHQQISTNRVRVIERDYYELRWKDIQEGGNIGMLTITEINPETKEILAYAVYDYSDKRKDDIITHYDRIKRYPHQQSFAMKEPLSGAKWPQESLPAQTIAPSYITGTDIERYLQGENIEVIGTAGNRDREIEVLYHDEFIAKVKEASDEEAVEIISAILTGKMQVTFSHDTNKVVAELSRLSWDLRPWQRKAITATYLPPIAKAISTGFLSKEDAGNDLSPILSLLKSETKASPPINYALSEKSDEEVDRLNFTVRIANNFANFPEMVLTQPNFFPDLI